MQKSEFFFAFCISFTTFAVELMPTAGHSLCGLQSS